MIHWPMLVALLQAAPAPEPAAPIPAAQVEEAVAADPAQEAVSTRDDDSGVQGFYGPLPLKPKDALIVSKSEELDELFTRRGYVLTEGPSVALVERVGASVAGTPPDDYVHYRFGVVRNEIPNAFALPDGRIYVHEGLLALLENEAQLAAVLAHEVMHVEGHHAILHARQARKKAGGMVVLSVLIPEVGQFINIALMHAIIGYGRRLEAESDHRAIPRMLEAGYDPREMPRVFELLDQDPEGTQLPVRPAWADHPLAVERARTTRAILEGMAPRIAEEELARGGLRVGREDFDARVAGSAKSSIQMHVDADRPRLALQLAELFARKWPDDPDAHALLAESYRGLDARQPVLGEEARTKKAIRSRLRVRTATTREEREVMRRENPLLLAQLESNWRRAEESYRKALEIDSQHPESLRGLGALSEERGELAEAGRWYVRYLYSKPSAPDETIVLRRLAAITEALQREAATRRPAAAGS